MMYPPFNFDSSRPVDLICMGRVAVDLYAEQIGSTLADATSFKKYLGGCAGNIAVGASRLGLKSMMFSCVGQDEMGAFLKKELQKEGVNIDLVYETDKHLTGLVLLGVRPPRDFPLMFYRNDCADMQLNASHISEAVLRQAKSILVTGTGLSTPSMSECTHQVIRLAKKTQTAVLFDLDYRPVLWGLTAVGNGETRYCNSAKVSAAYKEILSSCDLIVGTEEELCIAGDALDVDTALKNIRTITHSPIVIKLGEKGSQVCFGDTTHQLNTKSFPVEVLNVLGAGDAFMSGLLSELLTGNSWERATTCANASGALVVTRHGCAPAIPYKEELDYFIQEYDTNPLVWKSPVLAKLHDRGNGNQIGSTLIKSKQKNYAGLNSIVSMDQSETGMNFHSLKLDKGQSFSFNQSLEFAALLMTGRVEFYFADQIKQAERSDYFSEAPIVLHCPAGLVASVKALTDCELLLMETKNIETFTPMLFDESNSLEIDDRGKDLLQDTSYRIVRTVFDKRNRPLSNLVVGEIITFQGRWSSYPPHYHEQPEIYHYRFSEPQGFAFGEHGKEVLRIEHGDTYQIANGQEHAHCTAPGYALYTLWFIRHLKHNPYHLPTFVKEHEWTRTKDANLRVWNNSHE